MLLKNHSVLLKSMTIKITCYLLVGLPASGKSTLSKQLAKDKNALVLSTDTIRKNLYGSETIQGDWQQIEASLHAQILESISKGQSVIVDATHTVRDHRKVLLNLSDRISWECIYLKTDIKTCYKRNLKRSRTVPSNVIDSMHQNLLDQPPKLSEGFQNLQICEA